jgi:peptidoglycan/LPS O-acetylase OafA/YrhL
MQSLSVSERAPLPAGGAASASATTGGAPDTVPIGRRAQIDGLRAMAMLGVLYVHYWGTHELTEHLRVSLFFVVSGFLITHILYRAKTGGLPVNILNFYARRALRLFPALLIMIAVATLFNAANMRDSLVWHALQLSNVYFALTEAFKPWVAAHLWSLNVLEHFYLLAPLLILLLSRTGCYLALISIVVISVFLRVNWEHLNLPLWWPILVLSFDPIAMGALAYLLMQSPAVAGVMRSRWMLLVSVAVLALPLVLWEGFGKSESYQLLMQPALCAIVVGAFHGYGGIVGRLLESGPARFLSQISYGVYMYHMMVWWMVGELWPEIYAKGPTTFLILTVLTIVVATLSWNLVERPIARLKDLFPTARHARAASGDMAETRIS